MISSLNAIFFKTTMMTIFQLNEFFKADHRYVKNLLKDDLRQTIQAIIVTNFRFFLSSTEVKIIKTTSKNSPLYPYEGTTNKALFKKILNNFYSTTKKYKTIVKYHNFQSRTDQKNDSNVDFSTSPFINLKTPETPKKKKLHNHSKNAIPLNKKLINTRPLFLTKKAVATTTTISSKKSGDQMTTSKSTFNENFEKIHITIISSSRSRSIIFLFSFSRRSTISSSRSIISSKSASISSKMIHKMFFDQKIQTTIKKIVQIVMTIVLQNFLFLQITKRSSRFSDFIEPFDFTDGANDEEGKQRGNFENIDYFDLNYDDKSSNIDQSMKHVGKDIYYKNVHIFVKKGKKGS